jgi:hypothetical protein
MSLIVGVAAGIGAAVLTIFCALTLGFFGEFLWPIIVFLLIIAVIGGSAGVPLAQAGALCFDGLRDGIYCITVKRDTIRAIENSIPVDTSTIAHCGPENYGELARIAEGIDVLDCPAILKEQIQGRIDVLYEENHGLNDEFAGLPYDNGAERRRIRDNIKENEAEIKSCKKALLLFDSYVKTFGDSPVEVDEDADARSLALQLGMLFCVMEMAGETQAEARGEIGRLLELMGFDQNEFAAIARGEEVAAHGTRVEHMGI